MNDSLSDLALRVLHNRTQVQPVDESLSVSRRFFNDGERAVLYEIAEGLCTECGVALPDGWHADHLIPHVRGGLTLIDNGQALCPPCNLRKGAR